MTFLQDVFHPLVTPLTTYTHSTRERGGTLSASDEEKLPPGGLVLKEGFPEWFEDDTPETGKRPEEETASGDADTTTEAHNAPPHIAQVLQYLRLVFSAPEIIDEVPLSSAANPSAWHAWRSHRAKVLGENRAQSPAKSLNGDGSSEGSLSPRTAQPGGARRPGEWNWSGVWEDRVRKVIVASRTESTLFRGGETDDVVSCSRSLSAASGCPEERDILLTVSRSRLRKLMMMLWLASYRRYRPRLWDDELSQLWMIKNMIQESMPRHCIGVFLNLLQLLVVPVSLLLKSSQPSHESQKYEALESTVHMLLVTYGAGTVPRYFRVDASESQAVSTPG